MENAQLNSHFNLRGPRPLSEKILFVHIGSEDIQALGGWPITHDYYGYATHILQKLDAKVIAFNLLFNAPDTRFPEHDKSIVQFFQKAGNVVLPFSFFTFEETDDNEIKDAPETLLPIPDFKTSAVATGFSNIGNADIFKIPVRATFKNVTFYSFGFELARHFLNASIKTSGSELRLTRQNGERAIPIDTFGRIRVNHFGDENNVQEIGFVDLLQAFPDSLNSLDVAGKIVLIDVTSPGIAALLQTPYSQGLPSSLLHATVAENIIEQSFLREAPVVASALFLFLAALIAFVIAGSKSKKVAVILLAIHLLALVLLSHIVFLNFKTTLWLFYPIFSSLGLFSTRRFFAKRKEKQQRESLQELLKSEVERKEQELAKAKGELGQLEDKILAEAAFSSQLRQEANERKKNLHELEKQINDLRQYPFNKAPQAAPEFPEIICAEDSPLRQVLALVATVATDDIPVLITGETGTGKELIAKAVHQKSLRGKKPFVALNCGSLSETLLESELFGHEKGSFTGAISRRKGRFELADGGVIFLDEISETTPAFQARLLRILQEGVFERVGGERPVSVDVRVIAACNQNLREAIANNTFREDLFYRLNGFPIALPPLYERKNDIDLLTAHFLSRNKYKPVEGFSEQAMILFRSYRWPGNIRELENVTRRAALLAQNDMKKLIQVKHLPAELKENHSEPEGSFQTLEQQILLSLRKLEFSRSAIGETARMLGNKDRGTITEYFRGICFQNLVETEFNLEVAAQKIADSNKPAIIERVQAKLTQYLENLKPLSLENAINVASGAETPPQLKGLPKKFHPDLIRVIDFIQKKHG